MDENIAKITRRAGYGGVFTLASKCGDGKPKGEGRAAGSRGRRGPG